MRRASDDDDGREIGVGALVACVMVLLAWMALAGWVQSIQTGPV